LLQEEILVKETIGHSHQCKLNLQNDKTLLYLCLLQTLKRDEFLKSSPDARQLLTTIDEHSASLGILLVWKRDNDLLIITSGQQPNAVELLQQPAAVIPLRTFLHDKQLAATIGKHTLLFGHALYASLLREVSR
jgi:hypothetical protein